MDRPQPEHGPVEDLRAVLEDEPVAVSATDVLLAAAAAGPPPERAWLVEEMARRDRQTAEALRSALERRTGSTWLHDELEHRAGDAGTRAER